MTPAETAAAFVRELLQGRAQQTIVLPSEGFEGCLQALLTDARREGAQAMRERCAKAVEGFKTGGPSPEHVSYWGETLAERLRALPLD